MVTIALGIITLLCVLTLVAAISEDLLWFVIILTVLSPIAWFALHMFS